MKAHPLSEIFPPLEGIEFDALVADIEKRGLVQPLVMYQGKILDGRNRWRACEQLGIKPKTVDYRGDDPLGHVLALNLSRRHLTESQRAMVGAKIATLQHGGDRRSDQAANLPLETQAKAAASVNVSERSVRAARAVLTEGTRPLVRAVERGEIPVSVAAKVAEASPQKQREAVKGGKEVARAVAKEVVEKKQSEKAEPEAPTIRSLGLTVPKDVQAHAAKEQAMVDKMSSLLAELKRTFTEYEKSRGDNGLKGGQHIASRLRIALDEFGVIRKQRPASVCFSCKLLKGIRESCPTCRATGFVGEADLAEADKALLAEGDDAGIWMRGKWRTLAEMTGDNS